MTGTVSTEFFLVTLGVLTFSLVCAGLVGGGWAMYRLVRLMRLDFSEDLARARTDCEREIQDLRAANQNEINGLTGRILSLEATLEKALRLMGAPGAGVSMHANEITVGGDAVGRDAVRNLKNKLD